MWGGGGSVLFGFHPLVVLLGRSLRHGHRPRGSRILAGLLGLLLDQVPLGAGQNGNTGQEGHRNHHHGKFLLPGQSDATSLAQTLAGLM